MSCQLKFVCLVGGVFVLGLLLGLLNFVEVVQDNGMDYLVMDYGVMFGMDYGQRIFVLVKFMDYQGMGYGWMLGMDYGIVLFVLVQFMEYQGIDYGWMLGMSCVVW